MATIDDEHLDIGDGGHHRHHHGDYDGECSNNPVTITTAPQSGLVVEDAPLTSDPGDSLDAAGTICFTDVDPSDCHTASFVAAPDNTTALGAFSLDPVSEVTKAAKGSVQWHYALDNGAAQYLAAGQSVVEHYTVTVDDGHGSTATQVVTITIAGTNDPVSTPIDMDATANSVAENAAVGTVVGVTTFASDPDATDKVTYSLVDDAHGAFQIDAGTGVVTVLDGSKIDRESDASLDITVRASSSDGSYADQAFTIAVGNINEAPTNTVPGAQTATEDTAKVFSSSNGNQISISDVDDTIHTVTLTATNGAITLNGTSGLLFTAGDGTSDGTMTFSGTDASINAALNGLSFLGATNFHGAASIQVVTTDGDLSDIDSVAITVNEAPVIAPNEVPAVSNLVITNNSIRFVATDPDNTILSLTSAFAAAFGNPTVISAATTALTPTEQVSEISGELQVTDGSAATHVVSLYLGTGFGTTTAVGGAVDTAMYGFGGDDRLSAGSGADWLFGGSGNDTLFGAQNDRVLDGGTGNDTLRVAANFTSTSNAQIVSIENVLLSAGLTLNLSKQTEAFAITGSSGIDRITGGSGADTITGAQNDALLDGRGGTDTLRVAANFASTSNAQIVNIENVTSTTAVVLDLSKQTESLHINGSSSGDTISGGSGADTINGQAGNDRLNGLAGNDFLLGGLGNDSLNGGIGADNMRGQAGNDLYFIDNVGDTVTELASAGIDEIRSSISTSLNFGGRLNVENLTLIGAAISGVANGLSNVIAGNNLANSLFGLSGNDRLLGLGGSDLLVGGAGNDTVYGDAGDDTAWGDDGNDTIYGGSGADKIVGGTGADRIDGGLGNDTVWGDAGNDIINGGGGGDRIVGDAGNDTVYGDAGNDTVWGDDGNDTIYGGSGADQIVGGAGADHIDGNLGNDTVWGDAGNDVINGGGGDDRIIGDAGNDTLNGGLGADTMDGDAGDDVYVVDNAGDVVNEGDGNGIDTVRSGVSFSLADAARVFGDVERLTLIGTGNVNGLGNELANVITGNNFNNTLDGGAGNDTLQGGLGNDVLSGGAGNDVFVFDTAPKSITNNDSITDFSSIAGNEDAIWLSHGIFTKLGGGAAHPLNPTYFHLGTAATHATDYIVYNQSTGALYYDADGNGSGSAIQFAALTNHAALTASDFLVT